MKYVIVKFIVTNKCPSWGWAGWAGIGGAGAGAVNIPYNFAISGFPFRGVEASEIAFQRLRGSLGRRMLSFSRVVSRFTWHSIGVYIFKRCQLIDNNI